MCIVDPLNMSISKTQHIKCHNDVVEEVVDNKRQTEQGLMTVKWMKNCSQLPPILPPL